MKVSLILLFLISFKIGFTTEDSTSNLAMRKLSWYYQFGAGTSYLIAPKINFNSPPYEISSRNGLGEFISGIIGLQLKQKWNIAICEKFISAGIGRDYTFFENNLVYKDNLSFRSYNLLSSLRVGREFSLKNSDRIEIGVGGVWNYDFKKTVELPIFEKYNTKPYDLTHIKVEQYNFSSVQGRPSVYITYLKKLKKNSLAFNLLYEQVYIYYDTNFYTDKLYSFTLDGHFGSLYSMLSFSINYRL